MKLLAIFIICAIVTLQGCESVSLPVTLEYSTSSDEI